MTRVTRTQERRQATRLGRKRSPSLGFAGLGVLAIVFIVIDSHNPVRGLLTFAAMLLVPGAAVLARTSLPDIWARACLIVVASAVLEAAVSLIMVWTSFWHPQAAAVAILAVSSAGLIWWFWQSSHQNQVNRAGRPIGQATGDEPAERPRPPRSGEAGRGSLTAWLLLLAAVVLWIIALARTDVSNLGDWGLVSAFPVIWYVALALVLIATAIGLSARAVSTPLMSASVGALVLMLYASAVIVEPVPRFSWVYKHIAVTQYIELHGSVDPSIDIYNRWPGFFSFSAFLGEVTSYTNPVSYASWAETIFLAIDVALVIAIARTIALRAQWYWTAAVLFTVSNWIGQNYFSPQAFSYTLYLAIFLIAFTYLQRRPRGFTVRLEERLRRIAASRNDPSAETPPDRNVPGRVAVTAAVAVVAIQVVIVASHQLTPYLVVLALLLPIVLGYIRPVWMGIALAVLCLVYLAPNYDYVQEHFGILSGLNPIDNVTATPGLHLTSVAADRWQDRISVLLSGLILVMALLGFLRRIRAGHSRTVIVVAWLAVSPALSLLAQTYGGEGLLRVFLFALPWCAMGAAWLIWPSDGARSNRRSTLAYSIATAVLSALFVVSYFQPEANVQVTRTDLAAAQWLDQRAQARDAIIDTAGTFPTRVGPHYNLYGAVVSLALFSQTDASDDVTVATIRAAANRGVDHRSFIVFSDSSVRYADSHLLYKPGELKNLEGTIASDPDFVRVYVNSSVRIYQIE